MDARLDTLIQGALSALPRGRRGVAPSVVREIVPEDVPRILANPASAPANKGVLKVRHIHHLAARMAAEGRSNAEISLQTGFTSSRMTQLRKDPSFIELIAHYEKMKDAKWLDVHARLAALGVSLTEEMQRRLDEDPESINDNTLNEWAKTLLDRSGYGPKSTRDVNVRTASVSLIVDQIKAEAEGLGSNVRLLEDRRDAAE